MLEAVSNPGALHGSLALWAMVALLGAAAALPWLKRRWQAKTGAAQTGADFASLRVLGAAALGPQQRVLSVQVGQGAHSTCLVLGATGQNITCLHVLASPGTPESTAEEDWP